MGRQCRVKVLSEPPWRILTLRSYAIVSRLRVVPLLTREGRLVVALEDSSRRAALEEVEFSANMKIGASARPRPHDRDRAARHLRADRSAGNGRVAREGSEAVKWVAFGRLRSDPDVWVAPPKRRGLEMGRHCYLGLGCHASSPDGRLVSTTAGRTPVPCKVRREGSAGAVSLPLLGAEPSAEAAIFRVPRRMLTASVSVCPVSGSTIRLSTVR
jgi:hypothetical protein